MQFSPRHICRAGRSSIHRLCGLTVAFWFTGSLAVLASSEVTLQWNAGPEPGLAGYHVLAGTTSNEYSQSIDVPTGTQASVPVVAGQTYYFAVTAYDGAGSESGPSEEVSFAVPAATPTPTPTPLPTATPTPTITPTPTPLPTATPTPTPEPTPTPSPTPAEVLSDVLVQSSNDMQNWTTLVTVTVSTSQPNQFFRTVIVPTPTVSPRPSGTPIP